MMMGTQVRMLWHRLVGMVVVGEVVVLVGSSMRDKLGSIVGSRLVDKELEEAVQVLVVQVDLGVLVVRVLLVVREGHLDRQVLDLLGLRVDQLGLVVVVEVVVELHSMLVNRQGHKC